NEGMAVGTAGKPPGRSPHMRKKKARPYLSRQAAEILVGPCGQNIPVKARLVAMAVPGNAEAVAIGPCFGFMRIVALRHERMAGRRNDVFQIGFRSEIGGPTTHFCSGDYRPRLCVRS